MEVAPADPTRVSGSALAVNRSRCWTRMLMWATIRLSCTPWTRSGTMGFLGPRWPGAGGRQQLPCLDPDGWLVRMLQANRNENPAAELKARAVKPIPIATGELPLPRGKLYPLTRSPLMGGIYSPIRLSQSSMTTVLLTPKSNTRSPAAASTELSCVSGGQAPAGSPLSWYPR